MKRLLLFGYFGAGNLGDDLLLWTVCRRLAPLVAAEKAHVTILTKKPYFRLPMHAEFLPRMDLAAVHTAIRRSDVVCAPGGGLLQDATSLKSLLYYLHIIRTAKELGKPVLLLAQGVGPISSLSGKYAASLSLARADYISVRDAASCELLRTLLPKGGRFKVTSDLSFALGDTGDSPDNFPGYDADSGEDDEADAQGDFRGKRGLGAASDGKRRVIICPKVIGDAASQESALSGGMEAVKSRIPEPGVEFIVIPLHRHQDGALARALAVRTGSRLLSYDGHNLYDVLREFDSADAVLSYRLHGCILAIGRFKPFVAIAYDPKVSAAAKAFGQACFEAEGLNADAVAEKLVTCLNDGLAEEARTAVASAKLESERDIDALLKALTGAGSSL